MKKFDKIILVVLFMCIFVLLISNVHMKRKFETKEDNTFKISLNRVCKDIVMYENEMGVAPKNINDLTRFKNIEAYEQIKELKYIKISDNYIEALDNMIEDNGKQYQIFITENYIYQIVYEVSVNSETMKLEVNIILIFLMIMLIFILIFIRQNILRPFEKISNLPYELAKGNLTIPLKENKHKYFGKFIWGMDMLRENLEDNKRKELELQKEKKTLILSLSHDIKTPLNAISLYAKAISRNLYKSEEKMIQTAENINNKVNEIENYMNKIIKASSEEFLVFEVSNKEVYAKDIIEYIKNYYTDKMQVNNIDFEVSKYKNCMIFGDVERAIEVIQNVIENAVKYGDGRKILLETVKEEEEYHIVVRNTGCTLSENELTHIFDSFYRGSNSEGQNGSGLGLYICRSLMHLMEGEILGRIVNDSYENWLEVRIIFRVI